VTSSIDGPNILLSTLLTALMKIEINILLQRKAENFWASWASAGFSRRALIHWVNSRRFRTLCFVSVL
jgi:hypothetical protein